MDNSRLHVLAGLVPAVAPFADLAPSGLMPMTTIGFRRFFGLPMENATIEEPDPVHLAYFTGGDGSAPSALSIVVMTCDSPARPLALASELASASRAGLAVHGPDIVERDAPWLAEKRRGWRWFMWLAYAPDMRPAARDEVAWNDGTRLVHLIRWSAEADSDAFDLGAAELYSRSEEWLPGTTATRG